MNKLSVIIGYSRGVMNVIPHLKNDGENSWPIGIELSQKKICWKQHWVSEDVNVLWSDFYCISFMLFTIIIIENLFVS